MDTIVNIVGGNPGGKAKYFLNDATTIKKLKAAADRDNMKVTDNDGSKFIEFSTGAYVSVVLSLIKVWQEMEGYPTPEDVDGLGISVVKIEIERDLAGIILHYTIELKVQGVKVKVTCYDTTLSMLVQSGKMLEEYCSRVLLPHLRDEIKVLGRVIQEKNSQVQDYGEPRATRQNKKETRKPAASLHPPSTPMIVKAASILELPSSSRSPRLVSYSPPVPKIVPLALLPPGQEEVEVLPPVRQVLALPPTPRTRPQEDLENSQELQMVEDDSEEEDNGKEKGARRQPPPEQDTQKEPVDISKTLPASFHNFPDLELEARFGLLAAIATSQSQIAPPPKQQECSNSRAANQEVACFPCEKCDIVCTDMDSLRKHMTEHTSTVGQLTSKTPSLTASGRPIFLTEAFVSKHQRFLESINNDHVDGIDSSDDDEESNNTDETCKVCKKTFSTVSSLQDHILAKHGAEPGAVLEFLKVQSQLLNTILAGQATQLQRVNAIALKQTCLSDGLNMLKEKSLSPFPAPAPAPSMPPSVPADSPVPAARTSAAPSYSRAAAGQQQEPGRGQTAPARPGPQVRRGRRKGKLLIAGDSLLANHHRDMIKEATKEQVQEVQEVKCYAATYSNDPAIKFRRKNFSDVVPAELEDSDYTAVLMQSSSVELTNLKGKGAAPDLLRQTALVTGQNMA